MAVSKRLRFEVLRRDNHACRYCGRAAPDVKLTVDHVVPVTLGGSDDPSNLVTACSDCNSGKTSAAPDQRIIDDVSQDAMRLAKALEVVADNRRRERQKLGVQIANFDNYWREWKVEDEEVPKDANWPESIERFLLLGLNAYDLTQFTGVAMRATVSDIEGRWKVFCGCCWKEIRERQAIAAEAIAGPDHERLYPRIYAEGRDGYECRQPPIDARSWADHFYSDDPDKHAAYLAGYQQARAGGMVRCDPEGAELHGILMARFTTFDGVAAREVSEGTYPDESNRGAFAFGWNLIRDPAGYE